MLVDTIASNQTILIQTLRELAYLRLEAEAMLDQPDISGVIEAVDCYRTELPRMFRNRLHLIELVWSSDCRCEA